MTHEEKDLLLKDLCARLPYGVKVYNEPYTFGLDNFEVSSTISKTILEIIEEEWKPYLRPMSSMTHDEDIEYRDIMESGHYNSPSQEYASIIDWLNEHHFDYHGLIEKGLAIEVTEENNPYKE